MVTTPRLTPAQRDVLERMKRDPYAWIESGVLNLTGEPHRHLAQSTVQALVSRGLLKPVANGRAWVLAE
jgi:hypothetical protein